MTRRSRYSCLVAAHLLGLICSQPALAVDKKSNSLDTESSRNVDMDALDRYSLVGAIIHAADEKKSVAVIRDMRTSKSLTLRVGEAVPGNVNLTLGRIEKNHAVLMNSETRQQVHVRPAAATIDSQGNSGSALGGVSEELDQTTSGHEWISFDEWARAGSESSSPSLDDDGEIEIRAVAPEEPIDTPHAGPQPVVVPKYRSYSDPTIQKLVDDAVRRRDLTRKLNQTEPSEP